MNLGLPFFIIWCCFLQTSQSLHIFLIGESIDRYVVQEWCLKATGQAAIPWTPENILHYRKNELGGYRCYDPHLNVSIGNIQVFGVNSTGKYLNSFAYDDGKNIVKTNLRIRAALEVYITKFGPPDIIYFITALWDFQYMYQVYNTNDWIDLNTIGSSRWNASLQHYATTYAQRIQDIENVVQRYRETSGILWTPLIGIRTETFYPEATGPDNCVQVAGKNYLFGLNDAVFRKTFFQPTNLSTTLPLVLFDFQDWIWSIFHYVFARCRRIFRDFIHPQTIYCERAGYYIAGFYYSKFLYNHKVTTLYPPNIFQLAGFLDNQHPQLILYRHSSNAASTTNRSTTDGNDGYYAAEYQQSVVARNVHSKCTYDK
jgi:hypothetical protein